MAINVIVQHNGGFLPNILLLTQAPIFICFDDTVIVYYYYPLNYLCTAVSSVLFSLVALHGDYCKCTV